MKKKKQVIEVKTVNEVKVESNLTNPLHGAKFWLFAIGAALLLVLGIWILIDRSSFGASLAVAFTGIVILIFAIVRIIPLIKARKTGLAKFLTTLEILINIILGVFLIYGSTAVRDNNNLGNFINEYYKFFLGFVFYAKAIFYFINSSLLKEETNKLEFWLHILIITLAVVIFATDFDATGLALLIAILALICAAFFILMSGGSYYNYRKTINKTKVIKEDKEKEVENKDELILPQDEDKQNETYVN